MTQALMPTSDTPSTMNWAVFSFIFTIASGVTIGVFMTIALVTGFDEISNIIMVCLAGLAFSVPIAWLVAKRIQSLGISANKEVI